MEKVITIHVKAYRSMTGEVFIEPMIKIHRAFDNMLPDHDIKRTVDGIIELLQQQQREVRHAKKHKRVGSQKAISFPK